MYGLPLKAYVHVEKREGDFEDAVWIQHEYVHVLSGDSRMH